MMLFITVLCLTITVAVAAPFTLDSTEEKTYDQRQSGQVNIRLNIKDVAIISLEKDSFSSGVQDDTLYDDDYDYDADQLTINPALGIFGVPPTNKPTPKPTVSSSGMTGKPPALSHPPPHNIQEIINQNQQNDEIILPPKPIMMNHLHNDDKKPIEEGPTVTIKPATNLPAIQMTTESLITPPKPMPTKAPSVVIIQESTAAPMAPKPTDEAPSSHVETETHKYSSQYMQQIPVQVVVEPVLRPKINANQKSSYMINRFAKKPSVEVMGTDENVKRIQNTYESEIGRSKCSAGTYLDRSGRCRVRRSGLGQLLSLLLAKAD